MLDGLDRHRLARQAGLILDAAEVRDRGRNLESAKVAALEPDAVVRRRRLERQRDFVAGMKADSGAGDGATEGALRVHDLFSGPGRAVSELSKQSATRRHRLGNRS